MFENEQISLFRQMTLGRDESKHISCRYVGHEDDCSAECSRCAIAIKTNGDIALSQNQLDNAIRLYKKAVFIEPKFAEAWINLGNAYGIKSEYNNALIAFEKALAVDSVYGKALLGKAITLRNLNRADEAFDLADYILELYPGAQEVLDFKATLGSVAMPLNKAIDVMTQRAYDTLKSSNLLVNGKVVSEKAILCQEDFSARVLRFCQKRHASFGVDKVYSESVLTAFYGSLCTTLFFYNDKDGFEGVHPFEYLRSHADLEETETVAERLLGIRNNESACTDLWNLIYGYTRFSCGVIEQVSEEDKPAAAQDATESAYTMGMMYAMLWHDKQTTPNGNRNLQSRLEKVSASIAQSSADTAYESSISYERIPRRKIAIRMTCSHCQRQVSHWIVDENEILFDEYEKLASGFAKLGFNASVSFYCSDCARENKILNSYGLPNNFVFSISSPDGKQTAQSYPAHWCYRDVEYQTALAFLNGADSVNVLAEATKTNYSPEEYLKQLHMVLDGIING